MPFSGFQGEFIFLAKALKTNFFITTLDLKGLGSKNLVILAKLLSDPMSGPHQCVTLLHIYGIKQRIAGATGRGTSRISEEESDERLVVLEDKGLYSAKHFLAFFTFLLQSKKLTTVRLTGVLVEMPSLQFLAQQVLYVIYRSTIMTQE